MNLGTYNAIVGGCGLVDTSSRARIWSTGRDRIDLIHRMSTNDLNKMALNEGRATILTTAVARMIDRLIVINLNDRALLLGGWDAGARVRKWLSGYIFYNDQIKFEDASTEWGQFDLVGRGAAALADSIIAGVSAVKKFSILQCDGIIVGRGDSIKGDSFFVVAAQEKIDQLRQQMFAAGAVECDRPMYDLLRIESGIPDSDHEISQEFIPLEANLWGDVSFSKGCYIGQEIIARMDSRGKLAKTLVGVESASPLVVGTKFDQGVITSGAQTPLGHWIGLAFVKPDHAEVGTEFIINGSVVRVASLPFAS